MSPRYYLITTLLVALLTFGVCVWKQKRSVREILMVMVQVIAVLVLLFAVVVGCAKLLVLLGIAESGFLL
jgi:hypothetical protein